MIKNLKTVYMVLIEVAVHELLAICLLSPHWDKREGRERVKEDFIISFDREFIRYIIIYSRIILLLIQIY